MVRLSGAYSHLPLEFSSAHRAVSGVFPGKCVFLAGIRFHNPGFIPRTVFKYFRRFAYPQGDGFRVKQPLPVFVGGYQFHGSVVLDGMLHVQEPFRRNDGNAIVQHLQHLG